jgi:hypothetical protein
MFRGKSDPKERGRETEKVGRDKGKEKEDWQGRG